MRWSILLLALVLSALVSGCASRPTQHGLQHYSGVHVPGSVSVSKEGAFVSTATVAADKNPAYASRAAWARLLLEAKKLGYAYYQLENGSVETGHDVRLSGFLHRDSSASGAQSVDAIRIMLVQPMPKASPVTKKVKPLPVRQEVAVQVPEPEPAADGEPLVILAPDDVVTGSVRPASSGEEQTVSGASAPAAMNGGYDPDSAAIARRILGHNTRGPLTGSRLDDLANAVERLYPQSTTAIPSGVIVRRR